ncbi:PAS/PAC sensor signal transduction histidine kinase [Desulfatibacillum aliphaticivorans]|uniref:histidine kinase n=1 Tax=Desulfatibacillum aliphaticivorans TaxID=218208 RepID=B8FKZ5_DESAL|nr:PAS domain S-box protein [Desulfatibacillum aliphaticivorans]ACL04630.1 PAS/PAC sensor signal transduction histidine kinase [Desulfatibacillum aliphaticivorans]
MDKPLDAAYIGRILNMDASRALKERVANCIQAFQSLESIGAMMIPYVAAWNESDGKVWYEFASPRFCDIMSCKPNELSKVFPESIIDRRLYSSTFNNQTISRLELLGARNRIREEGKLTGQTESVFKVAPPGKSTVWLKDQAVIECYPDDFICISIGALTEVTKEMEAEEKRKLAEAALADSERKYRQTFENAPTLIVLSDSQGKILDCNPKILPYLGYSPQDVLGCNLLDFTQQGSAAALQEALDQTIKNGQTSGVELLFVKQDGRFLDANVNFSALTDELGRNEKVVCGIEDVTHKKQMEEELVRTRKLDATGILAGGIAHDFNNLLTVIIGNMELTQLHGTLDGSSKQALLAAKDAAVRAFRLTNKFITFSQGGSPVRRRTAVTQLIENAIMESTQDTMSFALMGSRLEFQRNYSEDLWDAMVDEGQMRQVFMSILANAKEAMPRGGEIFVSAKNTTVTLQNDQEEVPLPQGQYIKIAISDQGVGIHPENLEKIFDPYFSTKDRGRQKGMGLGLSIAYSVVKKHDGFITVKPRNAGGVSVVIYLPACP